MKSSVAARIRKRNHDRWPVVTIVRYDPVSDPSPLKRCLAMSGGQTFTGSSHSGHIYIFVSTVGQGRRSRRGPIGRRVRGDFGQTVLFTVGTAAGAKLA